MNTESGKEIDVTVIEGPPLFPVIGRDGGQVAGATVRDFFAAAALQGMLARQVAPTVGGIDMAHVDGRTVLVVQTAAVDDAFKYADLMLERRKR